MPSKQQHTWLKGESMRACSCDPELLVRLSDTELEVLADNMLAPRLQERLDHLLQLNREHALDNDTKQELDRLLKEGFWRGARRIHEL